mgnify:CR=1 FL=1
MNYFKLGGLVAAVVALLAVVTACGVWLHHYDRLKADSAALAACGALAARPGLGGLDCPPNLREAVLIAAKAQACDAGLAAGDRGAFAVQQACGPAVKHLVAERDKAAHDAADAQAIADQVTAHQSAAVARAEARGAAQTQRNAHASEVLNAAPRDAGGRTVCGPDCLRGLDGS